MAHRCVLDEYSRLILSACINNSNALAVSWVLDWDSSVQSAPQVDALCLVLGFHPDSIRARPQGEATRGDLVMSSVTALNHGR